MPCKTVVFTGDSVFLTALNYLQAAGRAGRRGFDILGNVVFHGINPNRVCEVMSSRLPDLRGHFPVSTTLVLRVMTLLSGTNNSAYSVKAVESMLSQTRLYLGGSAAQQTIQHHLRFSIEYLRRQQLLSIKGSPLNFAGLVGHLYFTENAVFAFHALLKAGYFHDVCRGIHDNPKDVLLELVLVLAHLFARIPCQRFMDQARIEDVVHRSPSVVFLPRLPDRAEDTLRDHNRETLDIFRAYVGSYVHQHLSDVVDCELPFTKHRISAAAELSPAIDGIPGQRPPTLLRSPFTALSGFNDTFVSIKELCSTVRSGVFLEDSAVPYIPLYPDDTEGVPMNAYIYDFFKHGDLRALEEDNGIKRSDVWFSLKDFSLVIATIVTSLANYLGTCAVDDSDMIEVQDGSEEVGDQDEDDLPPPSSTSQGNLGTQQSSEMPKTKKKPKKEALLDSWEDGDVSSEEDSGSEAGTGQGADASASAWDGQEARGLVQVYQAFVMLQNEFDTKFKKIGA